MARMKNSVRRAESRIVETALQRLGIPTLMRPKPPATLEGGDAIFLDEDILLLGVGNRTSNRALHQLVTDLGNARLRRELTKNGVDLIEGSELIRGFGGPRCMTLPTLRD